MKRGTLLSLAVTLAAAGPAVAAEGAATAGLPAFASCDALLAHMRTLATERVGPYGLPPGTTSRAAGGGRLRPAPPPPAGYAAGGRDKTVAASKAIDKGGTPASAPVSSTGQPAGAAGSDDKTVAAPGPVGPGESGTNRQEQDVAEADIAQTDGRTVVSLRNGRLRVFTVEDGRPRARGALALGALTAHELLLSGDRVLVVGRLDDRPADGRWHQFGLGLVDIAKPERPRLLGTHAVSASHVSTRMVGGVARVVLTSSPYLVFSEPDWSQDAERRATARNRAVVRAAEVADWLPTRRAVRADGTLGPVRPLLDCTDVRRPTADAGLGLLSVLNIDLASSTPLGRATPATGVVTKGDLVYASAERLYVATARDARRGGQARTELHSFDVRDPRRTAYAGSGAVPGTLLGRWAMSEHRGDLRIVSTYRGRNGGAETGIVVLRPRDGGLVRAGALGGLGRGERVYAVRWFDALAAVVTFRQTDPLHLVDLSDPEKPRVRGELEVPGFSEYLHPIGGGHLLGVGLGPAGNGRGWGLQLSTFDIADPDAPTRTDVLSTEPSSTSGVQRDARRFLYLPELRSAVLPVEKGFHGQHGLLAVGVGADHTLTEAGFWRADGASGGSDEWRPRVKALALGDGLLAALDGNGLTVLDAAGLTVRGHADYPRPR